MRFLKKNFFRISKCVLPACRRRCSQTNVNNLSGFCQNQLSKRLAIIRLPNCPLAEAFDLVGHIVLDWEISIQFHESAWSYRSGYAWKDSKLDNQWPPLIYQLWTLLALFEKTIAQACSLSKFSIRNSLFIGLPQTGFMAKRIKFGQSDNRRTIGQQKRESFPEPRSFGREVYFGTGKPLKSWIARLMGACRRPEPTSSAARRERSLIDISPPIVIHLPKVSAEIV